MLVLKHVQAALLASAQARRGSVCYPAFLLCRQSAHDAQAHPLRHFAVNCASQMATIALAYDIKRCWLSLPPVRSMSTSAQGASHPSHCVWLRGRARVMRCHTSEVQEQALLEREGPHEDVAPLIDDASVARPGAAAGRAVSM